MSYCYFGEIFEKYDQTDLDEILEDVRKHYPFAEFHFGGGGMIYIATGEQIDNQEVLIPTNLYEADGNIAEWHQHGQYDKEAYVKRKKEKAKEQEELKECSDDYPTFPVLNARNSDQLLGQLRLRADLADKIAQMAYEVRNTVRLLPTIHVGGDKPKLLSFRLEYEPKANYLLPEIMLPCFDLVPGQDLKKLKEENQELLQKIINYEEGPKENHVYYPDAYQNTLWHSSSLVGCNGYVKDEREWGVVDADGGFCIALCPTKEDADVIAESLNGKFNPKITPRAKEIVDGFLGKENLQFSNGSVVNTSHKLNDAEKTRGTSNNLSEPYDLRRWALGIKTGSNEKLLRQQRLVDGLAQIKQEQDLRVIWGDLIVNDLLEIMDFKELLEWANQPCEFFNNRTPNEVVRVDGVEHLWDFVEHLDND